ncbi:hypothetical protein R1sor_018219 [Riccia sorocarpa]|uniref:Uncharacterized protein n=1 Tax=Riccia sorocarpa TaxID=122646 RepID=A0ABD3ID59_9MARC
MGTTGRVSVYTENEKRQMKEEVEYLTALKKRGLLSTDTPTFRSGIGTNPSSSLNNPSTEAGSVGNNPGILPSSSAARVREGLEQVAVNPAKFNPLRANSDGINPLWSDTVEETPIEGNPEGTDPEGGNPESVLHKNPDVLNPDKDHLVDQNREECNPIVFNSDPIPLGDPNWNTRPGTPAVTPSVSPRSGPSSPRGSQPHGSQPRIFFNIFGTTAPSVTPQPPVIPHTVTPIQAVPKTVVTPPSGRTTVGTSTPPVQAIPGPTGVRVPT